MKTHDNFTHLKATLRELIIEELDRQLPVPQQPEVTTGYVSVKELCDLLQVSRQTIANWRKNAAINELIAPFIQQQGRSVQYSAAGIQEVIKTHPHYFPRMHLAQPETASQLEEKRNEEYKRIYLRKAHGEPLTETETAFYQDERERRGIERKLNVPNQRQEIKQPETYVSEKELCEQLKVSRQTVNNWRKGEKSGRIMAACMQKKGSRNMYNIEGIKRAMQEHPDAFGRGRDYLYRCKMKGAGVLGW